jgi:cell division transport system permease protein
VDHRRIFVTGHSGGAFMAYALACLRSDAIAAVVVYFRKRIDQLLLGHPGEDGTRLTQRQRQNTLGLILLALSVALVVLATVFNTVRMQALSQREEIGVARLVGATESFVRRPFLYLGSINCSLAALIAICVARLALIPLNDELSSLARSYDADFALALPSASMLALAVIGVAALGALSARWSVQRNTRF